MNPKNFALSIPEHTRFLDGHLDAVGRALTSDDELVAICAQTIESDSDAETILGGSLGSATKVENWSREFGELVETMLGTEQSSRLGFYLIEYICWFEEFTRGAVCYKFNCALQRPLLQMHATYILELECEYRVLIFAARSSKPASDAQ